MQQSIRLVLTGGGTGGHIIPNIALIQALKERFPHNGHKGQKGQLEILYIGSSQGMEKKMIDKAGVPFKGIVCGKLRRYFSLRNFVDFFKFPIGIAQSFFIILEFKPAAVFCKGGYVSLPVAIGSWLARKPVFLHESDVIPGLANRICGHFATKIFLSFKESEKYFRNKKTVVTGNPVRPELKYGDKNRARAFCNFKEDLPVVMVMGGSQGASFINEVIWNNLDRLVKDYQVIHICGAGKVQGLKGQSGKPARVSRYAAFEYVDEDLKDFYALADLVIARAGAITLAELDYVNKPAILIPLGKKISRGDQIINAKIFARNHLCKVLEEEKMKSANIMAEIKDLFDVTCRAKAPFKNNLPHLKTASTHPPGFVTPRYKERVSATELIINQLIL